MVVAPALMAVSTTRHRKSRSEREASSAENSTLSVYPAQRRTPASIICSTTSGSLRSLYFMCRGEVERKVWMRGFLASFTASQQRSMSLSMQRHRPATWMDFACRAIRCTDSKSPWLEAGKPASIMSTPSTSSW